MRISKLLKELKLSFDSLKLYEPYLGTTFNNFNQKITEDTYKKIIELTKNKSIQDELRIKYVKKKKVAKKIVRLIGLVKWYLDKSSDGEYGFLETQIGDVYFNGKVVEGCEPSPFSLEKKSYVIFNTTKPYSIRPKALKVVRLEDETDLGFIISKGIDIDGFLNRAAEVVNTIDIKLKLDEKNLIEKTFNTFLEKDNEGLRKLDFFKNHGAVFAKDYKDKYFLRKIINILNISLKLDLKISVENLNQNLRYNEKFEILKETSFPVFIEETFNDCVLFILEGYKSAFDFLDKLNLKHKKELLLVVYNKILAGVKSPNLVSVLDYLKKYISVNFNDFPTDILLQLWFAKKINFFPVDAVYDFILKNRHNLKINLTESNRSRKVELDINNIFNSLTENENRELFFRSEYEIEEIKEISTLKYILFIIENTNSEGLKTEFSSIIFNKSSDFIKCYLFVEDYTDELDYYNAIIYTGLLSSAKQKIFFKKVLMLIETNVLNVGLEELSKIIVFEYQDNVEAKSIDGVGLDFTLSIILRIANDLKSNTITNQQTMFEIIANQIKTPQDFLQINGFFSECTGRTIAESVVSGQGEEQRINYITKKTDFKPRFSTFCDGRKAIHKLTGKPILSTKEQFEFWWCENSPCFEICRKQIKPENWRNYTLEDVLRILNVPFSQYQYEVVLGVINKVNRFLEHLKCTSCKTILRPKGNSNYSFYRVSEFSCTNENCTNPDKDVYLTHCLNGNCSDIIDSRTTVKCKPKSLENVDNTDNCGWYICNNCLSCCSSEKLVARKKTKEYFGQQYKCHIEGHKDLGIICCPKCGTETEEKKIDLDKYNELLDWFKSKIGTVAIEKYGQRDDGKWWFRWRQGNIDSEVFKNALLQLKKNGFQVPNYYTSDDVQFISESFNKLNTIPNSFECGNCNHTIDLSDKEEFDVLRVRAVKSFHNKIFPKPEKRN